MPCQSASCFSVDTMYSTQCVAAYILVLVVIAGSDPVSSFDDTQSQWIEKGQEELEEALSIVQNTNKAKNVILFIGDGMGPNTITAARIYSRGWENKLTFEEFPHVALIKTYCIDKIVPDSAATASALFSGVKTNFETMGVDAKVKLNDCELSLRPERRLETIVTQAQREGKHTGFVTTTRITHATPGSLYAHVPNRRWECNKAMPSGTGMCKDIARQLVEEEPGKNLKVIMGGGKQLMTWNVTEKPGDPIDSWACSRTDDRDLIKLWIQEQENAKLKYKVLETTRDLENLDVENTDTVLGIFANSHMAYEYARDKTPLGQPSLADMTRKAVQILSKNKNGFLLLVEGGNIDQAHHRGHARAALEETAAFNEAIQAAMDLTDEADTLIVVTADHAHGLNINGYPAAEPDKILGIAQNSKYDGIPYTTLSYATGGPNNYQFLINDGVVERRDPVNDNMSSYEYSQQTGILNDEVTHGGVDVNVYARGPMAHLFHGLHEQSYITTVIQYAAKLGPHKKQQRWGHYHQHGSSGRLAPTALMSVVSAVSIYKFIILLYKYV